ncbi:MAG: IclR family transcriptional regulator [Arenibacterium sp.]
MSGDGTVGKALDVLSQVAAFERPVRFGELQAQSAFPKATLYRFLQTLTNQGMLAYDPDRQTYALGMRLVRLAHAAWEQSSLAPIAKPYLNELSGELGETVHLAQLDASQVLYVDKRNARQPVEMYSQAGKVGPAYCTGVGKAMLAHLPEEALAHAISQQSFHGFTEQTLTTETALREELAAIRARGYAYDREEHERGIVCVAAPIRSPGGRMLGALSITGTTLRTSYDQLDLWAPRIVATAEKIGQAAETWHFPETVQHKAKAS